MSSKETALRELEDKLDQIDEYLLHLDEDEILPIDAHQSFLQSLAHLQHKDIPAEMCSEVKIWERIEEAVNLMEDIQYTVAELAEKSPASKS